MKTLPTPRRLLDALALQRSPVPPRSEPVLWLDTLPPQQPLPMPSLHAEPLGRRAIEQALEEGSRRTYVPMREEAVLPDRPRR